MTLLAGGVAGLAGCGPRPPRGATSAAPLQAKFTDITEAAGLDFIQAHGGCGLHYFVEQVAAGACLFDADGDGFLDIYFPAPKPLAPCKPSEPLHQRLYLNDGHGRFTLAPNAFGGHETDYGIAAYAGDYDNDGHPDLYVCCSGRSTLYHNNGNGTFTDVTEQAGVGLHGFATGAVWFDYDGNGFLDLYVSRYCEWTLATDIPCYGPHGERGDCNPIMYKQSTGVLYHNNGDGTFTDVSHKAGIGLDRRRNLGAAAFDFDGDGRLDLFVANDIGPNFLYHNKGDGTFEDVALQQGVTFGLNGQTQANMGVAVGDYNDSGRLSVLVTTFSGEPYTVYRNDGGYFTDISAQAGIAAPTRPFLGFGTGFFDSRNLGRLDLFFANGHVFQAISEENSAYSYKERNQLLLNDGTGHFTECPTALPADDVRVHRGACFGDFDNNGRIDILVTANNDRPTLLRNDCPPANWLLLKLTDKHGCATPVGTRCVATIGNRKLTRVLLGGGSYAGGSDPRVHFGLGTADAADIEIHWLSGHVQHLPDVKANQIVSVREPA
ncbi:MAG: CRTAC1 family protein [Armatimonadota bacterium]|nr:CRTAC1 family protein [Armatimonadota bacterium]